jgi:hypothetical protein
LSLLYGVTREQMSTLENLNDDSVTFDPVIKFIEENL